MDFRNVLVPVDFSSASQFAVDFAVSFARKFRARLTLLHVLETGLGLSLPNEKGGAAKQRYDEALARLSAFLSPEDQDDLDLQIRILSGNIEDEIRAAIEEETASIVVMGTHQHGLIRRLLAGSVTEDLLRRLAVPIVTVSSDSQTKSPARILYATDLTESSHDGFNFALDLAQTVGAHLIVLHVIEPVPISLGGGVPLVVIPEEKHLLFENARRKLADLQSEGARRHVAVVSEVTDGVASERILEKVAETASELIVLAIHDKSLVERALLGSTAEHVVRRSNVPVLSFPVHFKTDQIGDIEQHRAVVPDSSTMP